MPCRSDEEDIQLPSDPDYITPPTDRRKCGLSVFHLVVKVRAPYLPPLRRYNSRSGDGVKSRELCAQLM